jgi:cell wall-associated NlpC family hydrolase
MVLNKMQNIKDLVGIPYKAGGRDKSGIDCLGLVAEYLKAFEIYLPEPEYNEHWAKEQSGIFSNWMDNFVQFFTREEKPCKGDIVLFRNVDGVETHAGIMLDNQKFIHAIKKAGVCISSISQEQFKAKVSGFYRVKNDTK